MSQPLDYKEDDSFLIGQDFGRGVASWFGLDENKVASGVKMNTAHAEAFSVTLTIYLSADDVAGIGKRMQALAEASNGIVESHMPEPVMGENPTIKAMRNEYNELNERLAHYHESLKKYLVDEHPAGGSVAHVDAPEEPEPVSMDAVWLDQKDCTQSQMQHCVDFDGVCNYLVQSAMLTDEQKQKAKESGK